MQGFEAAVYFLSMVYTRAVSSLYSIYPALKPQTPTNLSNLSSTALPSSVDKIALAGTPIPSCRPRAYSAPFCNGRKIGIPIMVLVKGEGFVNHGRNFISVA